MTSTNDYSQRIEQLHQLITDADYVLIGAGAGLSAAAGLDYAGEDFRQEFSEWINRYGITDLYSASFYPFKTEEELWAFPLRAHGGTIPADHPRPLQPRLSTTDDTRRKQLHGIHRRLDRDDAPIVS